MKNVKIFIRTFTITGLFVILPLITFWAMSLAYEGIRTVAFGDTSPAVEIAADNSLDFFDINIKPSFFEGLRYYFKLIKENTPAPLKITIEVIKILSKTPEYLN